MRDVEAGGIACGVHGVHGVKVVYGNRGRRLREPNR